MAGTTANLARWFLAVSLLSVFLAACQQPVRQSQFYIFGTLVDITLAGVDEEEAAELFGRLREDLQSMHRDWHPWEPGKLGDINRAFAEGRCAEVDARLERLIRAARELERRSGGLFNPALGNLIELWGFHTSDFPVHSPPPDASQIRSILALRPSSLDVYFDHKRVCSRNREVRLDLSGIAKGYAVDLAIERLRNSGIEAAIVNAGGDLRAYTLSDRQFWRVAVRHPREGLIGLIEVTAAEAVFTSGNYQRFVEYDDQRFPHILDPRDGMPVRDVAAVTVIMETGMLADAAATALMVAGLADWPQVAARLGAERVLVVDEAGNLHMTPAMRERIILREPEEGEGASRWQVRVVTPGNQPLPAPGG